MTGASDVVRQAVSQRGAEHFGASNVFELPALETEDALVRGGASVSSDDALSSYGSPSRDHERGFRRARGRPRSTP